ncbi:outer membrane beta-barrel protein [Aestuariirhabdus sp. Z084]|uniref:OmpW/AlkL family protein n=1 Tax=Aestuariirhabdus haliotis TaxID=2918751 RepID=UPI00201B3CEE|nr:OmpW family outer membrane protein [Aestuariirhabdus haliotis]MCL6415029.1 outer membrane beta-barrel protein [Aestuariirhabdus haliotis]MCL6418961.1 outer membrane beta-barrel protein [Aestuariirhabdus haliotis]
MKKLTLLAAIIAASTALSGQAMAREAGDIIFRAGAATVDPTGVDSDELTLNGTTLANTEVSSIDSNTQLGLTLTWMITDKVGLDLLAATPFEHDIKAQGLEGLGINKVGSTKHLPPTLSVQYHPMGGTDSKFQPFFGLGLNYTTFFDEDASSQLESGLNGVTGVNEKYDLDLDDSWGMAFQAGADYFITDNIALNATVWKINIETDATFKGKTSGTKVKAKDVDINPWVYMVGIGYKF